LSRSQGLLISVLCAALLALSSGVSASAVLKSAEESSQTVQAILIEGAINVKPSDISSRIKTRIGSEVTREGLRQDLKSVWDMDRFDDVTVDVSPVSGGVQVTFVVKERPIIRDVKFVGVKEFSDKDLKDKTGINVGDFENPVVVKEATERIFRAYRDKGYPDVLVSNELAPVEEAKGKVDLVFNVSEGKKVHIRKIIFDGNKVFPEGALKKGLKNKEAAFFFQSGLFMKDEVERDAQRLVDFYRNEGYQKVRVVKTEVLETAKKEKNAVDLKFTISEGILYNVRSISFQGATLVTEKEMRDNLDLPEGAKLSQRRLEEGMAAITGIYTERGYIYARVIPDLKFDEEKGEADILLRVFEGRVAYLDRILVRGNEETKDKVILREVVIKPGEVFDSKKIRRSMERIYNLGFFEDVKVDTEPSLESGKENLVFEVKERQTGTISLGGGYSSQYGFVGFLQLTKANLFGLGIRISAEWEFGQKRRNVQLDYFDPYFWDSPVSLGLSFWDTDRDLPNTFTQKSTGGSVEFGYRFWENWRATLGYRYQVDDVDPYESIPLPDGVSDEPLVTSSPNASISRDTRDSIFDPMEGDLHRLYGQVAGGPISNWGVNFLGGDTKYYKLIYDYSVFLPFPKKMIPLVRPSLGLHTRAGRTWGFDHEDVPLFEKFFLGGTDSIRGYKERALGPIDPTTGSPAGGRAMWQFNAELKWPLIARVLTIAAPFYDVGNSWAGFRPLSLSKVESEREWLATSIGFGIRLTIPNTIMVVRLDYGWGLNTRYDESVRSPSGQLHFNLGNIF